MLAKLTIKNVALIEYTEIEFGEGLNVLSGETGAGKSIILDSVNFVLGAKADRNMIRYGETECFVKAEFFMPNNSKAVLELRELDIESDGEIIISRKFSDTGKNVIKINGNTVTVAMLRKVTDALVDVHGQSEHFFLLKESNQLKTLDAVVGEALSLKKDSLSELLKEKRTIKDRISMLGGDEKDRSRRLDILAFQIEEIENTAIKEGEEEELISTRNKIQNLEKIISVIRDALNIFSEEGGVLDALRASKRSLSSIAKLHSDYENIEGKIETLAIEADDVASVLSDLGDNLYFDENELSEIESRLDTIRSLKRKYGANKEEIDEYLHEIKEEYELLSNCEEQYAVCMNELSKLDKKIYQCCREITTLRKEAGNIFCNNVTDELKTLNISNAQFFIDFKEYDKNNVDNANKNGLDEICFQFSANAGEPVKPLSKIISGGEMSRFMLSIKTQLSDINEISTYIFDEIDAGISGKTAKVVGEKLAQIAKHRQIIAVSHLAQIAVMSDIEFLIEKQEFEGKTQTFVRALNNEEQKMEIVRLLGGNIGDKFAEKHAEELLEQARSYKNSIT